MSFTLVLAPALGRRGHSTAWWSGVDSAVVTVLTVVTVITLGPCGWRTIFGRVKPTSRSVSGGSCSVRVRVRVRAQCVSRLVSLHVRG